MLRKILATTVLSFVSAGAIAADLPTRTPAPAPAPVFVAAPIWTGFYVGVNAGYAKTDFDAKRNHLSNGQSAGFVTDLVNNGFLATDLGSNNGTFTGGLGLGYNFQAGSFVFGIEADVNYLGADSSRAFISGPTTRVQIRPTPDNQLTRADDILTFGSAATASVDWLGTLRGRIGYSFDRVFVYGTGGLAFGNVKVSGGQRVNFDCNQDCGGNSPNAATATAGWAGSASKTQFGWAAGLGAEFQVSQNWTMKAEWLHYDLGSVSYNNSDVDALAGDFVTLAGFGSRDRVSVSGDMFRVGVNYKFGGSSASPVVARY